jgi:hypothetical protein
VPFPPPPNLLLAVSHLTALRELRLGVHPVRQCLGRTVVGYPGTAVRRSEGDVTDEDLLHLAALREHLTCLTLAGHYRVSAPGLAALLGNLTNLRRLKLDAMKGLYDEDGGRALVEVVRPLLSQLSSIYLYGVNLGMAVDVRDMLVSMMRARGCALELEEIGVVQVGRGLKVLGFTQFPNI